MRKPTTLALLALLAASGLAAPAHAAQTCYGRRATVLGTKRSETLHGTDTCTNAEETTSCEA